MYNKEKNIHFEMDMLYDEPLDLDNMSSETANVSELIFVLRSAFQPKEFNKVEEILVARENRLSKELLEWKKKYEMMEKKHGISAVNNIKTEKEMGKCKRQLETLTEQVTRLQEDNRLLEERERRAQAKFEKALDDNERTEKENKELVVKISESEAQRVEAERELESVKKKNEELELRVCRIEEFMETLVHPKVEEEEDSGDDVIANGTRNGTISANSTGAEVKEVILNGHEKGSDSVDTKNRQKREGTGFGIHPCNEGHTVLERGDSSHRDKRQKTVTAAGKTETGVIIDISDSDNETPAHNQTPNVPKVALPEGGNQCTSYLGIGERENGNKRKGFSFSSSSSESCDSETIYELLKQRRGSS